MSKKENGFKKYIMSFTYKEQRSRDLQQYRDRISTLRNMDNDELNFEYISIKSKYEHKKSILTLFVISIALAILMNVWKYFFDFLEKALQLASSYSGNKIEIAVVLFWIGLIMTAFITFVILYVIISYTRELNKLRKELLIIETIMNKG